jgi:bifunctional ADP-heptose synthase (sugar kinase/adenylyltransferase)
MKKSGKITALIHDAGGKMLRQHVAWLAVGANNVNLNVQALATGVYFLNITGEDGSKTTLRIVKKI